jgi:predicted tellurium resistance membrane protein TerC
MTTALIALVALSVMEIVLGIDNIVFIAIITGRLPESQRPAARRIGLLLALVMRIGLLFSIKWVMGLTEDVFRLGDLLPSSWQSVLAEQLGEEGWHEANGVSWRDLILFGGGLFLIAKATYEIHHQVEGQHADDASQKRPSFASVLIQIAVLDIVFSLDSVITAVGMADEIWVMIAAVVLAVGVMIAFANQISEFVSRHPSVKMLALSFLILIGVVLVTEAAGAPLSKSYVYFAMAFSLLVELLNLRTRAKSSGTTHPLGSSPDDVVSA